MLIKTLQQKIQQEINGRRMAHKKEVNEIIEGKEKKRNKGEK